MDPSDAAVDVQWMGRALLLAERGEGSVEPNPMVGCVIARGNAFIAEGWHQRFGQAHAEVEALRTAGEAARGATLYVTLEPCCHHGQTPPCTEAIMAAGIARVVAAQQDPFPRVAGGGVRQLQAAGIVVDVGVLESAARALNAPYHKLLARGRPWVIAKWAMTLDGKIASRSGESRWISGELSRQIVHMLRGRVDAILIGRGTACADDPLLTARPPGPRIATRVVLDSRAALSSDSQLVRTAREVPVIVVVTSAAPLEDRHRLTKAGCEVLVVDGASPSERLERALAELGQRRMTNVLVEGGSRLLGACWDAGEVDEVHVFIAPRLVGGQDAISPVAGRGWPTIAQAHSLVDPQCERVGDDFYVRGRVAR
jgi:diaminohydroxyphosphoribosylaminopyrimidine deaminase/5-amino-6-(5-phosphoribosylamino)uracil reductase